jgi:hypothetical protein
MMDASLSDFAKQYSIKYFGSLREDTVSNQRNAGKEEFYDEDLISDSLLD